MSENKKVTRESLQAAIELLMNEIKNSKVSVSDVVNMAAASAEALGAERGYAASVEAVYNAVKGSNHAGFAFIKGTDGQTFDEAMADKTPEELKFYIFKDGEADNQFDLYIYDSQQGSYIPIVKGGDVVETPDVDLSKYWSKDELDPTEFAKAADIPETEGLVKAEELDKYMTTEEYEADYMTAAEVAVLFNQIKDGTIPPSVGVGEDVLVD